eukprot:m.173910 g.173910  ORF g.173910 m.173910 type:complete len:663 (+) comp16745_c0_seq13:243-2231(+)
MMMELPSYQIPSTLSMISLSLSIMHEHLGRARSGEGDSEAYWRVIAPPTQPFAYTDEDLAAGIEIDTDNGIEAVGGLEMAVRLIPVDRSSDDAESSSMARRPTLDAKQLQCYTSADESDLAALPAGCYVHNDGEVPGSYDIDLGAVLHIDGARALPANVSVSKVVGRIYNRHQEVLADRLDTGTSLNLDSDMSNPEYSYRMELNASDMRPTALLVAKLNVVNDESQLATLGYIAINLFCQPGKEHCHNCASRDHVVVVGSRDPVVSDETTEYVLNEGGHQLRVYSFIPQDDEWEIDLFEQVPTVPCTSVLVRILLPPLDEHKQIISRATYPPEEWLEMGLAVPAPSYTSAYYRSNAAYPSKAECSLLQATVARKPRPVREFLETVAKQHNRQVTSERVLESSLRSMLKKSGKSLPHLNLGYYAPLHSNHEIAITVLQAHNLPKKKLPVVLACIVPLCDRYTATTWNSSQMQFTNSLDIESRDCTLANPSFEPEMMLFRARPSQTAKNALMLIDVRSVEKDTLKPLVHAYIPLFGADQYVRFGTFEVQCYQGSPAPGFLEHISRHAESEWPSAVAESGCGKQMKPAEGATLTIRVQDTRIVPELIATVPTVAIGPEFATSKKYLAESKSKHVSQALGKQTWREWQSHSQTLLERFTQPEAEST